MDLLRLPTAWTRGWAKLRGAFHRSREVNLSERDAYLDSFDTDLSREVKELLGLETSSDEILENLVARELNLLQDQHTVEEPGIPTGEVLAGRFEIIRQIGKGGMGTIYEALDQELSRHIALKVMRGELAIDALARERFYREISLASRITHPNACRIFDLFRHEKLLFLTMELLHGETLHERIRREGPLDLRIAMEIVLQISQALEAIHRSGIIHRDFKSSNIILVPENDGLRVVVTDFGLAITPEGKNSLQVTRTGEVLGTPEFMAPEQLKRSPLTPATDIYALGIVMFEMVTGEVPLSQESPLSIVARRISEDAPSPRSIAPNLDRNWERTILRCLERNPRHRFQTAREVVDSLQEKGLISILPFRYRMNQIFKIAIPVACFLVALIIWQRSRLMPAGNPSSDVVQKRLWSGATGMPPELLSTDGRVLIDVDWQTADLMAIEMAKGKKQRLTSSGVWFIPYDFSPYPNFTALASDGREVAYSVQHVWNRGCDLRTVGMRSTPKTLYSSDSICANPMDWSPDRQRILLLLQKEDGSAQLALMSAQNRSLRVLKSLDSADVRKASISPDGGYVAYDYPQQEEDSNRDIFVLSLRDLTETRVIAHKANDYLLGWPCDNKRILFASDRSGTYDAWILPVSGGKSQGPPEILRNDIGQIFPLKFTPDGSFYYSHLVSSMDIYTASLNSGRTRVTSPPAKILQGVVGSNRNPEFSPDGESLIFQTLGDPVETRWSFRTPDIFKLLSLRTNEEHDIAHRLRAIGGRARWSRDGRSILTCGYDGSWKGLYKVDMPTGAATRIVQDVGKNGVRQYDWFLDGKSVFYLRFIGGELMTRDISSGEEKKVCSGVGDFVVSKDRRSLAVVSYDIYHGMNFLKILPATGGEEREILRFRMPDWISALAWSPDSESVLFTKGRRDLIDAPHHLWKISMKGGKAEQLGVITGNVMDFRMHPDGRQIAIGSAIDNSEIWVLENFLPRPSSTNR